MYKFWLQDFTNLFDNFIKKKNTFNLKNVFKKKLGIQVLVIEFY